MMKKFNAPYISPEDKNELYKEGYRFLVEGDYRVANGTDPWSGMPVTTHNTYVFDNEEEATAFAEKQIWVFNEDVHATVNEIPEHTKTFAEWEEEDARKYAERKAKREANERKKAEAMGLTVEEYKEVKAKERATKKLEKEIAELEKELANKKRKLEKIKNGG